MQAGKLAAMERTSVDLPVDAILVTADQREIPLKVEPPVPLIFSVHRADGRAQIFRLQRTSLVNTATPILYVEDTASDLRVASFLPLCPVCGGETKGVQNVDHPSQFSCRECETSVVVPAGAWTKALAKRSTRWRTKP